MVDLCRPSSLPNNQSLGSDNETHPNNTNNSTFFSNVFVSFFAFTFVVYLICRDRSSLSAPTTKQDIKKNKTQSEFTLFHFVSVFCSFLILNYSSPNDKILWQQHRFPYHRWNNRVFKRKNYAFNWKRKKIKVQTPIEKRILNDHQSLIFRCQCLNGSENTFKNIFKKSIVAPWRQIRVTFDNALSWSICSFLHSLFVCLCLDMKTRSNPCDVFNRNLRYRTHCWNREIIKWNRIYVNVFSLDVKRSLRCQINVIRCEQRLSLQNKARLSVRNSKRFFFDFHRGSLFFLVPNVPLIPFASDSMPLIPPEQLWLSFNPLAPRSVYSCSSTGMKT